MGSIIIFWFCRGVPSFAITGQLLLNVALKPASSCTAYGPKTTTAIILTTAGQTQAPPTNTSSLADIMPAEIIQHEWQEHGTCSGLNGNDYLALIRKAFDSIRIPTQFRAPRSSFTISPDRLKREFEGSNSGLSDNNIAIQLRGHYLNAVEFCLSKDQNLSPVTCTNVRDARGGTFVVPPVR